MALARILQRPRYILDRCKEIHFIGARLEADCSRFEEIAEKLCRAATRKVRGGLGGASEGIFDPLSGTRWGAVYTEIVALLSDPSEEQ